MCLLRPERGWAQRVRLDTSEVGCSTHLTGLHAADAAQLIREVFMRTARKRSHSGRWNAGSVLTHSISPALLGLGGTWRKWGRERERARRESTSRSWARCRGNASDDRHPVLERQWWSQLGASAVQDWLQIKYRWIRRTWLKKMSGCILKMYIQKE